MKEIQLDYSDERGPDALLELHRHRNPMTLILDGLEDGRNLGAILRLADAARLSGVWCTGMSPSLLGKKAKRISRSTWKSIDLRFYDREEELLGDLEDRVLLALEKTNQSKIFWEAPWPNKPALVLGHEERGVSQAWIERCSGSIHLPMYGLNTSMNVAMAGALAVYEWLRIQRPISSENPG